jgi:RNA polymerase sigma factor (sigma-70 family)
MGTRILNAEEEAIAEESTQATVFVVDDDGSTRELLAWLMRRHGLRVELFADARSFLAGYTDAPGCLLVDLNMPGMNGLDLQRCLKEKGAALPVVFLSAGADVPKAVRAVKEGAVDFIEKPFDYRRVMALVAECIRRDADARCVRQRKREICERLAQLTQREREVLELVVAGRMNREIAEQLDISIKTVEAHRSRIMGKLEVHSLAELVQAKLAAC